MEFEGFGLRFSNSYRSLSFLVSFLLFLSLSSSLSYVEDVRVVE